jgi:hypothetical protein
MDVAQIAAELRRLFSESDVRVVFWNDPEREFGEVVSDVPLDGVTLVKVDEVASLELKIRIERDDPSGRYLLYSAAEEPPFENDWLLDMRLYGRSFRADRASILLTELGLTRQQLRAHIALRRKFFDNKDRVRKLKVLVSPEDSELDLDRKMLAVVAKAEQPDLFNIVRTLFHAMADGDQEIDLQALPPAWESIERFELEAPFWSMVQAQFGYTEENPNLRNLLIRLLVSDFVSQLPSDPPTALQHLVLPRSGAANAMVCLGQWRDSSSKGASYNALSSEVATILQLPSLLEGIDFEQLRIVMTFPEVEKAVARGLLERVTSTEETIDPEAAPGRALDCFGVRSGVVPKGSLGCLRGDVCWGRILRVAQSVPCGARLPRCRGDVPGIRERPVQIRSALPSFLYLRRRRSTSDERPPEVAP